MQDHTQEITALSRQLTTDNLATWNDAKRQDFADTFDARTRVARYLLIQTAQIVGKKARDKHFVSEKQYRDLVEGYRKYAENLYDSARPPGSSISSGVASTTVGGRGFSELDTIAGERSDEIIAKLPSLLDAVRILSPEVSTMMERRDLLLQQGKELFEQAEDLSGPLDMDDMDQSMTIAAFRTMVRERETKRLGLIHKLDEIGDEGRNLTTKIDKFLYDGLPGLSEAVIAVVKEHLDRAIGLSGLNRRVTEQVKFGDSEAALEMLKRFESDEATVSADIQAQFDKALEVLKLASAKSRFPKKIKGSDDKDKEKVK